MTYVLVTRAASMPSSCKGRYRRVAVMWSPDGSEPAQIRDYARGDDGFVFGDPARPYIVATWERLNVGGARSAYAKAIREAQATIAAMNGPEWIGLPDTPSGQI